MTAEQGNRSRFKQSLFSGLLDTQVRLAVERMADRWLKVEYWSISLGLVQIEMTTNLDPFTAHLHIESYILKHGINFDFTARVRCCAAKGSAQLEEREWSFGKTPARAVLSEQELPAVAAQAARVRQVHLSHYRADGRDRRAQPVGRGPAHGSARRANSIHGFRIQ